MARACGFCSGPGVSKEHLWPDWIVRIIEETRGRPGKEFIVEHERSGQTTRFNTTNLSTRVGMPCEACNNGWMSELENAVKPFMAGMIFPGHLTLLTEERRGLLARWAVKVAMVHEFFRPDGRFYFSDADRKEFMSSTQVRNDVYVWLAKYDTSQPMHSVQERKVDDATRLIHLYCLTLTANFLAIQVVASRELGGRRNVPVSEMPKGALMRIWPVPEDPGGLMQWPPPIVLGPGGLRILDTRFRDGEARRFSATDVEN